MTEPYIKLTGDVMAATIAGATLVAWLPPITALLTIVYTALRIWESRTVQGWVQRQKPKDLPKTNDDDKMHKDIERKDYD